MRRLLTVIFVILLGVVIQPCYAQKSNKPGVLPNGHEPLDERDNSFSTGRKQSFFSRSRSKKGFDHKKKINHTPAATKKKRKSFEKKRYTGKKSFFSKKKSNGWGGKMFKGNGKEDKRLFKAPKNKARDKKRRLLKKAR